MMERMQEQLSNQLQKEIRRQFQLMQSHQVMQTGDYNSEYPIMQDPVNQSWSQPQW